MLRSRNNNKNAHSSNTIQADAPSQTSSFTKLGVFICITFIIIVSYFAFVDDKSYTSPATKSIAKPSEHLIAPIKSHRSPLTSAMTAKVSKGGFAGLLTPKVLTDLKPAENDRLQRLIDRQDKLLGRHNKLNRAMHPLQGLRVGALNMDTSDSDTKEIGFTLGVTSSRSSVFVRQSFQKSGENNHDFVLLFLHGQAYTSATWSDLGILAALAKQGYVSYAVDIPGYGQSAKGHATDNKWLYEVVDQLCGKNDKVETHIVAGGGISTSGKKVILVTASMSGRFAIPMLFQPPHNLAGMITVAPVGTDKFTKEQYAKVELPVCVVYGEHDKGLGETSKVNLVQIPNHRVVMVPNGEHAAYKTDPRLFHEKVVQWLAEFED